MSKQQIAAKFKIKESDVRIGDTEYPQNHKGKNLVPAQPVYIASANVWEFAGWLKNGRFYAE